MKEKWNTVMSKGIDWKVSSLGRIWVAPQRVAYTRMRLGVTHNGTQFRPGKMLTPCKARNGYLEVARKEGGKRIKERVHRLVALAWVPGFVQGLTVNHINGRKDDNRPENLEWVSLSQNTKHQWRTGLANPVEKKLTSRQVVYIRRLLKGGVSAHALGVIAGVSAGYVSKIAAGLRRK